MKARLLPPDVIFFPEYDPSEDMDQKIIRKKKSKRALEDAAATDQPLSKSSRRCSTPANTTLPSPPTSPSSPPFELDPSADITTCPGVPLRSLPSGFVIHGNLYFIYIYSALTLLFQRLQTILFLLLLPLAVCLGLTFLT